MLLLYSTIFSKLIWYFLKFIKDKIKKISEYIKSLIISLFNTDVISSENEIKLKKIKYREKKLFIPKFLVNYFNF